MPRTPALTLAFLESQPRAAALVLQGLAPESAAALLARIAPGLAARAVAEMNAWAAARCLGRMDSGHVASLLAAMRSPEATQILRLLPEDARHGVLDNLPSNVARALRQSLTYPAGSVGAWCEPTMPVFREHDPAQHALDWLASAPAVNVSHVFVVDTDQRLAGAASVPALLAVARRTALGEIMRRPAPSIGVRLPLDAAAKSARWDEYLMLPVVDEHDAVLGGLTRAAVRRAMESLGAPSGTLVDRSVLAVLLTALLTTLQGLATTLSSTSKERSS